MSGILGGKVGALGAAVAAVAASTSPRGGSASIPARPRMARGACFPSIPELRAVLEAQRERTRAVERETGRIVPWVFHRGGRPIKDFRKAWSTACRRAGVPGRILHDFRRTAVRNLSAAAPPLGRDGHDGHLTESVYRRYAIVDEAMLREAGDSCAAPGDRLVERCRTASLPPLAPHRGALRWQRSRNAAILRTGSVCGAGARSRTSNPVSGSRQVGGGFDPHTLPPREAGREE